MSGTEGFEPPNGGAKNHCLTTWPRPILSSSITKPTGKLSSKKKELYKSQREFTQNLKGALVLESSPKARKRELKNNKMKRFNNETEKQTKTLLSLVLV